MTDVQARITAIQQQFGTPAVLSGAGARMTATAGTPVVGTTAGGLSFDQILASAQQTLTGTPVAGSPTTGTPVAGHSGTSGSDVVAAAKKYLGVPYVWGGTNPKTGLDCSGFVQRAFGDLGIDLPRTADAQAKQGTSVPSLAQARPGDLVAFDNAAGGGMDHIGIYLGGGKMIAAPRAGQNVQIKNVGTPDAIRRILPDSPPSPASATTSATVTGPGSATGVDQYNALFVAAGAKHGVPALLLKAVAQVESGGNPNAASKSATGLMQFTAPTAKSLGIDPLDPAQAVDGAARMLARLIRKFGTVDLALAAYNAGEGNVTKYGGIPPFPETQAYVPKVKEMWASYR